MNGFCNTTVGNIGIARDLIKVGHDHGGFFGPAAVTGDITCPCGKRWSREELTAAVELTAPASEKAA